MRGNATVDKIGEFNRERLPQRLGKIHIPRLASGYRGRFFSVNSGRLVAYRHTKDTISRYEMIFFIRYMGKKDHSADKVAGEAMGIW